MDIEQYIHDEVVRQKSDKFDEFKKAWEYANTITADSLPGGDIGLFLQNIARYVEPDVNRWRTDFTNLRVSEVGFANGGKATKAVEVPGQFERLCYLWTPEHQGNEVELWVKWLLEIHPFLDGNGRTASIFWNWHLQTLSDPSPLPYYFGE